MQLASGIASQFIYPPKKGKQWHKGGRKRCQYQKTAENVYLSSQPILVTISQVTGHDGLMLMRCLSGDRLSGRCNQVVKDDGDTRHLFDYARYRQVVGIPSLTGLRKGCRYLGSNCDRFS